MGVGNGTCGTCGLVGLGGVVGVGIGTVDGDRCWAMPWIVSAKSIARASTTATVFFTVWLDYTIRRPAEQARAHATPSTDPLIRLTRSRSNNCAFKGAIIGSNPAGIEKGGRKNAEHPHSLYSLPAERQTECLFSPAGATEADLFPVSPSVPGSPPSGHEPEEKDQYSDRH